MGRFLSVVTMLAVVVGGLGVSGCGEAGGTSQDAVAEVHITSDDQMQFDQTRFTVRSGQTVRLTLEHVGQMPAEQMGHNLVILQEGEDTASFGDEVQRAGGSMENQYVPEAMRDRVVAFTAMLGGGERDTIEFEAPEPGLYPFICSFPGHYGIMRGHMIVE